MVENLVHKTSARPIKIDKSQLMRLAKKALSELLKTLEKKKLHPRFEDAPLESTPIQSWLTKQSRYVGSYKGQQVGTSGNVIHLPVLLEFKGARTDWSTHRSYISGGNVRQRGYEGERFEPIQMLLQVSLAPSLEDFQKNSDRVLKELYSVLTHEVTHAHDYILARASEAETREPGQEAPEGYYNRPHEVRAFMQQMADEVIEKSRRSLEDMISLYGKEGGVSKAFKGALKFSKTWERVSPYLNRRNKNLILKGVWTALNDAAQGLELGSLHIGQKFQGRTSFLLRPSKLVEVIVQANKGGTLNVKADLYSKTRNPRVLMKSMTETALEEDYNLADALAFGDYGFTVDANVARILQKKFLRAAGKTASIRRATFKPAPGGRLLGYKVMGYDPETKEAVSGANSRIRLPLRRGATHKMPGQGIFMGSAAQYVLDYYSNHEFNVLITYSFDPADIAWGESQMNDREPEIGVSRAKVEKIDLFDEDMNRMKLASSRQAPSGFLEGSVYKDVLYHGSSKRQTELRPDATSSEYGIFLTPKHRYARRYGSELHKVLVNIKRPLIVEWKGAISPKDLTKRDIQKLKSQGYDGIVVTSSGLDKASEVIAFDSKQVHVLNDWTQKAAAKVASRYMKVGKMPRVQYHATSWDKVPSILRNGLRLPRGKQDVSTFVHDLPSISTTDKPADAQVYHPRGALLELRVKPGFKYLKRTSRMMHRGESLLDAVNRWGQEVLDKGAAGFWMEGWQSTVGNQTYNPDALEVVRVVNEEMRVASRYQRKTASQIIAYHASSVLIRRFDRKFSAPGGGFWFGTDKEKILRGESGAAALDYLMTVKLTTGKVAGWDEYDKFSLQRLQDYGFDSVKLDEDWIIFDPKNIKVIEAKRIQSTKVASRYLTALTLPPRKLDVFLGIIKKKLRALDKRIQDVLALEKFNKEFQGQSGYKLNPLEDFQLEGSGADWDDLIRTLELINRSNYGSTRFEYAISNMEDSFHLIQKSNGWEMFRWLKSLSKTLTNLAEDLEQKASWPSFKGDWKDTLKEWMSPSYGGYSNNQEEGLPQPTLKDFKAIQSLFEDLKRFPKELRSAAKRIDEMSIQAKGQKYDHQYMPEVEKVEKLYHASVNAGEIGRKGFSDKVPKTLGIGGDQGDKSGTPAISFTSDLWVASNVARALREAVMIAKGKVKLHQLQDWAKREGILDGVLRLYRSQEGRKPIDPKNTLHVFNFYRYYLFKSKRYNPYFVAANTGLMSKWKGLNEKNIGVVVAMVNMSDPDISFLASMQEYRVPPKAVISIEKVIR